MVTLFLVLRISFLCAVGHLPVHMENLKPINVQEADNRLP